MRIIFDGAPGPESGHCGFVEVEDDNGKSIKAGTWVEQENGFWALQLDMGVDEYQQLAFRTYGSAHEALLGKDVARDVVMLNLSGMGLAGESGEFVDHIKKWLFHGHPLDQKRCEKEIGDILWYAAIAALGLNCSLSFIMQQNIDKLKERYPQGFSKEASLNRKENQ